MVLSALLFSSGRFSPSRFSLDMGWTTPSLSQPNSKVSGSNWKLLDRAAMCDATFDATAAATLDAASQARLFPLLPVTSWERNEAFASPLVASSGQPDPEARAGAGAATDFEGKVCVPLVDAVLEGSGAMAPVLLVYPACESDLKGYVSFVFLPAPLVLALVLPHLESFEGWMLECFRDDVQATAASLLQWKSGLGIVDHFKTLVPGLHASSSVPVWKGMPKVKEDQRATVSLVSPSGVLQVSSFGTLVLLLLPLVQRKFTSSSPIATTSGMPSLLTLCLRPKQQPHFKVPAALSIQVPGKRNTRSSLSSFSSKGRSACQRLLSEGVWRRFCRKSLARMVWMCMP